MSKILGLDLGTNSIGWAVLERENGQFQFPESDGHATKGVLVFPEGAKLEAKTGSIKSRASERTGYRSSRRLKFRRKLRKYYTLKALIEAGSPKMCPLDLKELENWRQSIHPETGKKQSFKQYPKTSEFINWLRTDNYGGRESLSDKAIRREQKDNPYFFRDKFSRAKYEWESDEQLAQQLGRAFYHLAQRRGFKSNRLEQSDENLISDIKEKIQYELEDSENSANLYTKIDGLYSELDIESKKTNELDTTHQQIRRVFRYVLRVIQGKDYPDFEQVKAEIDRYINRPENLGAVKRGIKELSEKREAAGCETLGQYFWHLLQQNRHDEANRIRTLYTAREEHYEYEFDVICEKQNIPDDLKQRLYKAIFFQRPLKSQKGLVGKCTFESDKARCPVSRPEFEEFRMRSFINNIKIKTGVGDQMRGLTREEIDRIIPRFYLQRATFKMEEIIKELFPKGATVAYYKDREAKYTPHHINYKSNTTVSGCPVSAALKNVMGEDWKSIEYNYTAIDKHKSLVKRTVNYQDLWHVLFTFEDEKKLREFAEQKLGLSGLENRKFTKIALPQGYANLSLKAIRNILPWLEKGLIYPHAVFMANIHKVVDEKLWAIQENQELITNKIEMIIENHGDVVKRTLAINSLLKKYLKEEKVSYALEAESAYKIDLEKQLKNIYGTRSWDDMFDKEKLLSDSLQVLTNHLRKQEFEKIKRIDEQVIDFLTGHNDTGVVFCSSTKQLDKLYHPSDLGGFTPEVAKDEEGKPIVRGNKELKLLPLPQTDAIKNPVLMRTMHQLRKLINELLMNGVIDAKTRIHIELAREINDANKRKAWKEWQDGLREKREQAVKSIKQLYKEACGKDIVPSEDDVLRYLLWEEQGKKEIYETQSSGISICDVVGSDPKYDIEHTLPRSRSWDNSMMNKTLCSKVFNRKTKANKMPSELGEDIHEEVLQRIEPWKKRYEKLDSEIKSIRPGQISDPDRRNEKIVEKHKKTFERDYWRGKYARFAMEEIPEGFKNSQTSDTGLLTRFARHYLSCLFLTSSGNSNVRVVNGVAVDQFKRAWGLQEEYQQKVRSNHIHHCIDAVTIATMTKDKYDAFAEAWRKAEEEDKYDVRTSLEDEKPWPTFTKDVLRLEEEVLVVHKRKDNAAKQSRKKERKRGKVQFLLEYQRNGNGAYLKDDRGNKIPQRDSNGKVIYKLNEKGERMPKYQQGDTIRGSLHQDSLYGAIKQPLLDSETKKPLHDKGRFLLKKDKKEQDEEAFVVRKKLSDLNDADLPKIIDPRIRKICINARKKEKELKKEIEELKKRLRTAEEEQEPLLKSEIESVQHRINNDLFVIPPKEGKTVTVPIKKVRIKAHISEPLREFKAHRDRRENKDYKNWVYVANDENYCLAIYENDDRSKRAAQIVSMIDAAEYFKRSNQKYRIEHPLVPEKKGMRIKGLLKPGTLVLFYQDNPEELWEMPARELRKRLYFVRKMSKNGQTTFQFHQEARIDEKLKEDYIKEHGIDPPKSLTNGEGNVDFDRLPVPKLLLSPVNMRMIIEGRNFRLSPTGDIYPI